MFLARTECRLLGRALSSVIACRPCSTAAASTESASISAEDQPSQTLEVKKPIPNALGENYKSAMGSSKHDTKLYREIHLEIYGYDRSVLHSYAVYVSYAAARLGLHCSPRIQHPMLKDIRPILKSPFITSDHKVHYEMRQHQVSLYLWNLTGTTANVFLEYIERNLSAGLGMKVHLESIEKFPKALAMQMESEELDRNDLAEMASRLESSAPGRKRRRLRGKVHPDPEKPDIEVELDPFHLGHLRERGSMS